MSAIHTTKIRRIGRKNRKHLMLSRDLVGVVDQLEDGRSNVAEAAMWRYLVDEHGEAEVRDALTDVQADIDTEDQLLEPTDVEIRL